MLREVPKSRQIRGEPRRRWFTSAGMDLYIWYDDADEPLGFQLCYGKPDDERALTWFRPDAYSHMKVDPTGQSSHSGTPILLPDGRFDPQSVLADLAIEAKDLPRDVVDLVHAKVGQFP